MSVNFTCSFAFSGGFCLRVTCMPEKAGSTQGLAAFCPQGILVVSTEHL